MTLEFTQGLAEALERRVARPASPELSIAQWRLTVSVGASVDLGLKDNRIGGPYDAPHEAAGLGGEAYIVWGDGRVSSGDVDRLTPEELDEDLRSWRRASYEDPWAPDVADPSIVVPEVPLYDEGAAAWVQGETAPMFDILARLAAELPAYEAERVSGGVTAGSSERTILTSRGFRHHGRSTTVGVGVEVDGRAGDGLSLRRPPAPAEIAGIIRRVGEHNVALRREASLVPGRQPIVCWPSAAEALWGKYLLGNLDGSRVVEGGGAFTLDQFSARAEVFHPSLSYGVDPLRPLTPGAYQVSAEGVPAARCTFVEGGRLVTPLLDLKYARKAGMTPTAGPRGTSSHVLPTPSTSLEALIGSLERGLLVLQMLGLHTQDTTSGRFSLTVSQGLVVEQGRIVGRAKAIIAGNMLEVLRNPVTWASVAGKEGLALAFEADVLPG